MHKIEKTLSFVILLLGGALFSPLLAADHSLNLGEHSALLHGYDPVTYFDGHPRVGSSAYSARHGVGKVLFVNASNRDKFLVEPHRYLPAFGGYCAYGVRMGKKFDINPLAYEIVDGRLYLMLDRSTRELWKVDVPKNIRIAERIWRTIGERSPDELD